MSQRNLLILLIATAISYACYVRAAQSPYARFTATGLEAIDKGALDQVPDQELFNGAMQGMVEVLHRHGDEHSQFLTEEEADPLRAEIRQQFGGIGVRIRLLGEPARLVLVGPPDPGSPAARANLLPADHILDIDGNPTANMTMTDVLRLMRGKPGSLIRLTVKHEHSDETRTIELTRELITTESILGELRGSDGKWQFALAADPRIALVRITSFGDRTAEELAQVLEQLSAAGVEGVVLDLRDNPGGALEAAVSVCDLFLPGNLTVVETLGRDRKLLQRYVTTNGKSFADVSAALKERFLVLPLVVLVNQNSASAAEIVAACLQDHSRAIVVGQRSYGKGTVQQLLPFESGKSLLKLTWASFWRPSGANIHRMPDAPESAKWGVSPDSGYDVRLSSDDYAIFRRYRFERDMQGLGEGANIEPSDEPPVPADYVDRQLKSAVQFLQKKLTDPAA